MGLIDRIIGRWRREAPAATPEPASTQTGTETSAGSHYYDLIAAPTGLQVATVYRCVQLLSDMVAQLPLLYQRRKDGVYMTCDDDYGLNYLMNQESDYLRSAFEMKAKAVAEILLEGNAYIVPEFNGGQCRYERLVLCKRGSVTISETTDLYYVKDDVAGIDRVYRPDEIIHLRGMTGKDPRIGISVLSYAKTAIDIAGAGDAETQKRFEKGGNLRGILKNSMTGQGLDGYNPKQMEQLGRYMEEKLSRNFCVVPTPVDSSLEVLSMTSADMQFLESRKFAVRDICRFFGVHPSFVFDDTSNNYKSAEMANVAFLANTLNPLLHKIEEEFNRKLIGRKLYGRRRIEFDRNGLYTLDLDSKVKYYNQMIATGAMTVNEVRAAENMPAVEGGDKVFVSANLKWIDDPQFAGSQPKPQEPKAKNDE